jgi:hypothetical protein
MPLLTKVRKCLWQFAFDTETILIRIWGVETNHNTSNALAGGRANGYCPDGCTAPDAAPDLKYRADPKQRSPP